MDETRTQRDRRIRSCFVAAPAAALALVAAACASAGPPAPGADGTRPAASGRAWSPTAEELGGPHVDAARAGDVVPEPATPQALAVRWPIEGDDNGNAVVAVAYRPAGTETWRDALPLFWIHPAKGPLELHVRGGRLFAGSIFDLDPDTSYEIRLELVDPDGGSETRTLRLRTTREPAESPGLRTVHVAPAATAGPQPGSGSGAAGDPVIGLRPALGLAQPGDVLLLGPGTYRVDGLRLPRSGEPGQPIVLRGAAPEEVVLDGGGGPVLVDASGLEHLWFERLAFRNADVLLQATHARHIVIRRNRFRIAARNLAAGVEARGAQSTESVGFFVTDNIFEGPNTWPRKSRKKTDAERIFGIALTGAGHVIAHNLIRGVGDGVNNGRGGMLSASDIHSNDVFDATDDCIEADHAATNVRIFRNRLTNCFSGVSLQPVHGGPVYVFGNLILNTQYSPFKLHNHTSGIMLFHNTSVRSGIPFLIRPARETVNDIIMRNNLFIGTTGPALFSTGRMIRTDFDGDGYGWTGGDFARWNGARYRTARAARASGQLYAHHGAIEVEADGGFASGLAPPGDWRQRLEPERNDPRLRPGSRAVDRGVRLPNVNDDFTGAAPDLGCCELDDARPHFGPRPEGFVR
jgi:hypothetical protein